MTESQWNEVVRSLEIAPDITQKMFDPPQMELTKHEVISLGHALLCSTEMLNAQGQMSDNKALTDTIDITVSMIAGLYGRLLGLARAYDKSVTAQTILEAELASTGK
jgi:hypothetical protein